MGKPALLAGASISGRSVYRCYSRRVSEVSCAQSGSDSGLVTVVRVMVCVCVRGVMRVLVRMPVTVVDVRADHRFHDVALQRLGVVTSFAPARARGARHRQVQRVRCFFPGCLDLVIDTP